MLQYRHKKEDNIIIKAERYKKGKEDGYYECDDGKLRPFKRTTITGELLIEFVKKGDYIIYYEIKDRIFTGVYPKNIFNKFFKRIKSAK